jgi:hypothetical protein
MAPGIRRPHTAIPPQFVQRFDILCCRKSSVALRCGCGSVISFDCSACHAVLSVRGAKDRRHDRDRYRIVWHDQCQHFRGPRLRGISVEGVRHSAWFAAEPRPAQSSGWLLQTIGGGHGPRFESGLRKTRCLTYGVQSSTVTEISQRYSVFELGKHPQDDRSQLWQVDSGGFP